MYHPKEKKKYNQEHLAVARWLFLTSNLQLPPPTVYKEKRKKKKGETKKGTKIIDRRVGAVY